MINKSLQMNARTTIIVTIMVNKNIDKIMK